MDEKGTTLIELIITLMIIVAVGLALIIPNLAGWWPLTE